MLLETWSVSTEGKVVVISTRGHSLRDDSPFVLLALEVWIGVEEKHLFQLKNITASKSWKLGAGAYLAFSEVIRQVFHGVGTQNSNVLVLARMLPGDSVSSSNKEHSYSLRALIRSRT